MGLPGGRRIISVGVQLAQRVVDFGATGFEAADKPGSRARNDGGAGRGGVRGV